MNWPRMEGKGCFLEKSGERMRGVLLVSIVGSIDQFPTGLQTATKLSHFAPRF